MPRTEHVFNQRKRHVFRTRISSGEVLFGIFFLLLVVGMGAWFLAQRDNYDPTERDISMALMEEGTVQDTLYRTPLVRWNDPAQPAGAAATAVDLGVFPSNTMDGGWNAATRVQTFDESTLYEKINGAAPQYVQFGFQMLHFLGIEHPVEQIEMNMEVYDMGAFENALGIFAAQRDAAKAVEERNGIYFYPTTIGAIGIAGKYYFKLSGSDEKPVATEKAGQLVDSFALLTQGESGPPRAFLVLRDVLDIPFEGIVFEKSDVFQYQFAQNFWFGIPDVNEDLRYYIHEAESEEAAITLFDQLLQNHLYDYDPIAQDDDSVILNHKFLDTRLAMARDGKLIYGFDGAPADLNVDEILAMLQEAFAADEEV